MSQSLRSHMFAITALGGAFLGMIVPAAAAPNPTQTVFISGNTPEQKQRLIQALGAGNNKVVLAPIVDMNLSGLDNIPIAGNTILTGGVLIGPGVFGPARDASHRGPRLYTYSRPNPLFQVTGDNVKIEGFRIHGADFVTRDGDTPTAVKIVSHVGIEIANMELAGWTGNAIAVEDGDAVPGRLRRENPEAVWIHDNFIHHNLHHGRFGYGVVVGHDAYALIERNVFDFNRHAISADYREGTGYFALRNLVLKGGTGEGACLGPFCVTTHEFDVHGSNSCAFVGYSCGQAGQYFEMTGNAFQYTMGHSIKVRGNPIVGALVAYNVFASSEGDAIQQNGGTSLFSGITKPIYKPGNKYGDDTYGKYGVCDFDGDGIDDLFLATGASWWYMSGAQMHWVYLNDAPERLDEIGLGDFDGDHKCDVFSVYRGYFGIYSGGRGSWRALGYYGVPFSELRFGDFNGDGIMDIFRRAPDGQWWIISPGHYGWTAIASSDFPLSDLHFGDFDGNGVTDVIARQGGHWSISYGGRTSWQRLNSRLNDGLESVLIADIDHNGTDDILRYRVITPGSWSPFGSSPGRGIWEVSWDGRSDWKTLKDLSFSATIEHQAPAREVFGFVGRFRNARGADLVSVLPTHTRMGQVYDIGARQFLPHSYYAY